MPAGFGEDVSVGTAEPAGRADYDEWRGSVRGSAQEVVDGCTPGPSATSHAAAAATARSEEHTSELQSRGHLVCRLLLEKKKEALLWWSLVLAVGSVRYVVLHCRALCTFI